MDWGDTTRFPWPLPLALRIGAVENLPTQEPGYAFGPDARRNHQDESEGEKPRCDRTGRYPRQFTGIVLANANGSATRLEDALACLANDLGPPPVGGKIDQRRRSSYGRVEATELVRVGRPRLREAPVPDIRLPEGVVPEEREPQRGTSLESNPSDRIPLKEKDW